MTKTRHVMLISTWMLSSCSNGQSIDTSDIGNSDVSIIEEYTTISSGDDIYTSSNPIVLIYSEDNTNSIQMSASNDEGVVISFAVFSKEPWKVIDSVPIYPSQDLRVDSSATINFQSVEGFSFGMTGRVHNLSLDDNWLAAEIETEVGTIDDISTRTPFKATLKGPIAKSCFAYDNGVLVQDTKKTSAFCSSAY